MPIKIILILGLVALTLLCFMVLKSRLATRLFILAQFCVGVVLVLFPELANRVAALVGVGRGADLMLYLLLLAVYAGALLAMAKFRRLERQITELTRQVALYEAEKKE
ncbi:MAG: DUF2304 domain-containing protein [Victivallales bacterium]|nr:DUF2304 domain-containing protein [Victivallales bacterium]